MAANTTLERVTGYQFGDDRSFIGTYQIPKIPNQPVALPPKTMLKAPPTDLPAGKEAAANEAGDDWIVRDEDLSWMDEDSRAKLLAAQDAAGEVPA
ncbi:hypothetical protein [Rhodoferax sp.]|uniref:hypothetical protein n=1 Tax=Rhodoferax sp. TaxID=50421 RepID=UPI00374CEE95